MSAKTYNLQYISKGLEIFFRQRLKTGEDIDILSNPVEQYHNAIASYCVSNISLFNSDYFFSWFDNIVNTYSGNTIPGEEFFATLINNFLHILQDASETCFMLIPLQFSVIKNNVYLGDGTFIITPFRYEKKSISIKTNKKKSSHICQRISKSIGLSAGDKTISDYLIDFEKCYSKYILYHPLLILPQCDIFENVKEYALGLALYAQNCLNIILIAKNKGAFVDRGTPLDYEEIKHIFIYSKQAGITSIPIWNHQNYFPYNLRTIATNKKCFLELLSVWNINTELAIAFRKSMRFFCWDVERLSRPLEYDSIRIQMTFTGIETFLLSFSSNGEKKKKIAAIMSKLYSGRFYSKKKIRESVINLYKARSNYIHAGINSSYKYQPHLTESGDFKPSDESLFVVRMAFANILM